MARKHRIAASLLAPCALALTLPALTSCTVDLGPRQSETTGSFGSIVYREACLRVAYTADLQARTKNPNQPLDASGTRYAAYCAGQAAPPADADPSVRALDGQRQALIAAVDQALPDDLLPSLDLYLRALAPLQDDGTVTELLGRSGRLLASLSQDQGLHQALSRLGRTGGVRPPETAGAGPRGLFAAPGLDAFIGASLPLFLPGGAAREPFLALLRAGAFESRHLTAAADPLDPERSVSLLRDLSLSTHAGLSTGQPLLLARRDARGLPLLADIQPPYVLDPVTRLAKVNAAGRFVDAAGAEIPYVAPLPEPGKTDSARRDPRTGVALRADGQPLYQYVDLDGSLLVGLLRDAHKLFATSAATPGRTAEVNIPFGLLRGAAPLAGPRDPAAQSQKDGEAFTYAGYQTGDNALLDLAHGATQLVRFDAGTGSPAGDDLLHALQAAQALLAGDTNEAPLARALRALLDAADEAKKPLYDSAKLPADSTLVDDLAPVLARIARLQRVDAGGKTVTLLEDLIEATKDPVVTALGPISAQLAADRGYFFMRQPSTPDELVNGLSPEGVVGDFGQAVDRARPDVDVEIKWYGPNRNQMGNSEPDTGSPVTADARNNRSVLARLLHLLADTNGVRPFCNGRNASIFGGFVVFPQECDLFRLDNIARFFLLSIASPALREDAATLARPAASFLEAIKNGNDCRCVVGDPDPKKACVDAQAKMKCNALLSNIPDGARGDQVLPGLMGIQRFTRFPEPEPAARSIFLDLGDASFLPKFSPSQPKELLFNHVAGAGGALGVDPADPDNRKFVDGAGKLRLFADEHNGVLFALEKATATVPKLGGGTQTVNFYQALRPIVDAFARHVECFDAGWRPGQACQSGQNATQILADAMTVMHRHWPTAESGLYGRSYADSYGALVRPDGMARYEPLVAQVMQGDLLPAMPDLAPVLSGLTYPTAAGPKKALPLFAALLRFVVDPAGWVSGGMKYRDPARPAVSQRNDGGKGYSDATLTQLVGKDVSGTLTPAYVVLDALRKRQRILDQPQNAAARRDWDQAVSDLIDVFLQVQKSAGGVYSFQDRRLRPMGLLLLDFLQGRAKAHAADPAGWSQQMVSDLTDTMKGPLFAALLDMGVVLSTQDEARHKTYALMQQVLDETNLPLMRALGAGAGDLVQLVPDDADLVPLGRALSGALDPQAGPVDPVLVLAKRGRDLEIQNDIPGRPVLIAVLKGMVRADAQGTYPLFHIADAISEVNRATPGQGGDLLPQDYQALLQITGQFLIDQRRGMQRFIDIVRSRCLPGSSSGYCPK